MEAENCWGIKFLKLHLPHHMLTTNKSPIQMVYAVKITIIKNHLFGCEAWNTGSKPLRAMDCKSECDLGCNI